MKVLVTGSTGFIGGALVQRLCADGVPVRGLARRPDRAQRLAEWGADVAHGDLTDAASLRSAMVGCTHVVHAAAWVGTGGEPAAIHAVNVGGTAALVAAAREAQITRLVHISSTGVYGSPRAHGVHEDHPRRHTGQPYHDSKIGAEDAVLACPDVPSLLLRPSHVYGPGSTHFTVRPLRMLRGTVPLIGGGRFCFKPIWIDNLLDAIVMGLTRDVPTGTALNITDGYTRTWRQLFEGYAAATAQVPRFRDVPLPVARVAGWLGDRWTASTGKRAPISSETVHVLSSDNSYDNARAQSTLGWRPAVNWDDAMARTGEWVTRLGGPARFDGPMPTSPLELL